MDVIKYLQKAGYDTIQSSFYGKIREWESWYVADVKKFHRYRIFNGKNHIRCRRLSLGMAKKLSEDIADLLLNERVQITIQDTTTDTFVREVLNRSNFMVLGNDYQERKAYTGTVAYVPFLTDVVTDAEGLPYGGYGRVDINYVSAGDIYPLSWSNGWISECAFVFHKTIGMKKYDHIQIHKKQDEEYVIENHIVETSEGGSGREIPFEQWKQLKYFSSLADVIHTGSTERQFVIDRLNIANNYNSNSPMGMAIFANATDILQGLDTIYDSYINEFVLGKKRIFVAPEVLYVDPITGEPAFDPNDAVFYQLPEDTLKDGGKPITEVDMQIRAEEHEKGINNALNMLSVKCGFGLNHYKFENGNIQTATQVISENSDMYRTINKHEIILRDVLEELIRIIARLGRVIGVGTDPETEIVVEFDDSIIEDKQSERQSDRQDVSMGAMGLAEYRAKWYGETEEEAARKIVAESPEDTIEE